MTLTEFIFRRIAEDELWAREATPAPWDAYADGMVVGVGQNRVAENVPSWNQTHIDRHDPARVLADCEARRAILKVTGHANSPDEAAMADAIECYLALSYADHPDYRDEWRP